MCVNMVKLLKACTVMDLLMQIQTVPEEWLLLSHKMSAATAVQVPLANSMTLSCRF